MHVIVLDESKEGETSGVTLYSGREDEDPYKYLPYEEVDGRGLGVGVVEDLFEAQVWTNDSVKKKKDLLEIVGKAPMQVRRQGDSRRRFPCFRTCTCTKGRILFWRVLALTI